ncbi:hypothetical protein OCU04_012948 [Sclerotinia nivalis]|uniref:Uncharacterized protein n=1 Tax=Sclerotinia nivalis TaxID=352851 RepID=A0A9X0A922_9HELO|nr:hypothetical protein OCU04_012948 [Sclerotinia nivalis]
MVGARRTRAAGASPGGFKSLDDIPKPTRGRGKKVKTEPVEPSIESESSDPLITPAETNNNTESQKAQSSPTNASRTNSPDSHSPTPTPGDSRSASPPPKNNIASNDASSDNDVIRQEQAAQRIAPLESRKRSREDEPSTHQSAGITNGNAEEDVEQRVSKRTRRQQSNDVEDTINQDQDARPIAPLGSSRERSREEEPSAHQSAGVTNTEEDDEQRASKRTRRQQSNDVEVEAEAEKSTEPELEPKKKSRGRPVNRAKASPKKPANKTRGRKQDPIVLNDSSSDEAAETTVSPLQSRSTSAPKQPVTPSPHAPQHQQGISSAEEDEPQVGPSTISHPTSTDLQTVPQTEIKKPAPSLTETGPTPSKSRANAPVSKGLPFSSYQIIPGMSKTERLRLFYYGPPLPSKGKEVANEVAQGANDVAHQSELKTTAATSSSENLSKPDVPHSANQSPRNGLRLTDPYLVAVAKVFTNHRDKSKAMPSIEQVTAFLTNFDAQQPLYNPKAQMVTQKPTRPLQPKKPKRSGYCVPDTDSDDTDMSGEDEAQVVDEPKTPEAQISPAQDASPRSNWWGPFSAVATLFTSPFRKQSTAAPAPLSGNKLVPPPFIFNQPPTTPAAVPLKRMSHSDRKRNTRNVQGRLTGFQTELHPRHRDVEATTPHASGLLTAAELREIHRAQDEYAAKHGGKGPSIEANHDIHKFARASQRAAVTTPVEEETPAFTHAKAGEKRDADGAPKMPTQRWNDFLRKETGPKTDFGPRWIRCRNGLYIRENCTDRQFHENYIVTNDDPCWEDHYRDIDAFPKQDIFKPAGVQNPLNSAQLLEQAHLRARGVDGIPDESENDYTYVIDEQQKRLLFYSRSPYNMFQIPGKKLTSDHIENIKEGLPLLNPRDEYGIAIKTPSYDSTRPSREQKTTNVFQQLHDWDKKHYYKDAVEMKAGRILEPKQWSQTPPPKPKPGNAKLPDAVEQTPAPISEAVKHAMSRANKYLPAKGSGLRQVSNMSPLQAEQDRVMEAAKESKPMFNFDFSDESLGFHVDPLVKECVLERLGEGYVPITPMPDHIWQEHADLQLGEVERAVAKLFKGIDPRLFGSMHNGIKVPEQPNMAIEVTSESPTNRPALKLW